MKTVKIFGAFLALFILVSFTPVGSLLNIQLSPQPGTGINLAFAADSSSDQPNTIMRPTEQQKAKWLANYKKAPRAKIDASVKPRTLSSSTTGGVAATSGNLLSLLEYTPAQRNQGYCGNCWAWAGTGVMEIALNVQKGVRDRLSLQYLNSNYNGGGGSSGACCGGWLEDVSDFYTSTGKAIPWSNTGGTYTDVLTSCGGSAATPSSSISTNPYYEIGSISEEVIETQSVTQAQAIANIKNVLDQQKAVWFGFFFPRGTQWTAFRNFWNTQPESDIYGTVNAFSTAVGTSWDSGGGGHAVLCVGYYDDGASNRYWIMLNSWGTTTLRPNGLFKVPMVLNYSGTDSTGFPLFWWQTLDIEYDVEAEAPFLIGGDDVTPTGTLNKDTYYMTRFQAFQSGTATTCRLRASGPGNVQFGIYGDAGGVPSGKLYTTTASVIAGWNDITISYPLTGGSYYYLAYISNNSIIQKYAASYKTYYRSIAYSSFTFPVIFSSYLYSTFRNFAPLIRLYASVPVPPSTAPTLSSPGSAITFKWASVSGATTYRLQVNTSSSFSGTDIFNAELNNVTSTEVSGFTDNITYYWRVQAGNPYGWGPWSGGRYVRAGTP